jgi:hypothetical protein
MGQDSASQTPPTPTLLVKSQICRKQLGYAIFETQKDRDLAPVKRALQQWKFYCHDLTNRVNACFTSMHH